MAERQQRNMNAELGAGATDGTYKQLTPDWSNADQTWPSHRSMELSAEFYGSIVRRYDTLPLGPGIPSGTA